MGATMATRTTAATIVLNLLSDKFGLPTNYFDEADKLTKDWHFQKADYIAFMVKINKDPSHKALITPPEILACKTIGELIDLVQKKL